MEKVSTTTAKQSRNISRQTLTIGLDLGDRNSWYCVLDEVGQIQLEQRVRTTAKALREVFRAMPRSRIALEIGTHSPWISRLLSEVGHEVIVANARKVRLIGESRKKDDRLDAHTLARLARIDPELLYPVKHRSVQAQADLMTIRARAGLVRAPAASQRLRNSPCDFFASSYPNSVPQEGQISKEGHPASSNAGSASWAKPQTGQVCAIVRKV